ncbi:MauE/DoxX family redox-associated membrane protein [uncultured Pedobacter sp.]|uniref:MauE/DoxX family redox-associated membrane protein n=1 Tax=uncultured Pedobacter sp. TaxID=246139 RepID=UPI002619FD20|nr:MauE/DoxX family redox-associated membrane protein [uncultured Pedobacter sp.]
MKRTTYIEIISYAFIILFLYTAFSKLFIYGTYVRDLQRSPFIGDFAKPLSILLPIAEIVIAVLLFLPKQRLNGLYGSLALMIAFTAYVSGLVFTQDTLPCSCGGLIRELTWKQHFFFNAFFTALAGLGIWLSKRKPRIQPAEIGLYV